MTGTSVAWPEWSFEQEQQAQAEQEQALWDLTALALMLAALSASSEEVPRA